MNLGHARLQRFLDTTTGDLDVGVIEVVADVAPTETGGSDECRPASHERVEHEVILERVQTDELLGQLDGERSGVTDPARTLRWNRPDVQRHRHEVLGHQRALVWQAGCFALLHGAGSVESSLAGHDHPLADVAEHRIGSAAE